ncbi:MAG: hypothetical protein M3552_22260 [Planctomycetota bacterium]|nr:hypothetical protein [Planctomycetota bacterium]
MKTIGALARIRHPVPAPQLLNDLLRTVTLPTLLRHLVVSSPFLGTKTLISSLLATTAS